MPHPVDVEAGRRVRIRRLQLSMSQTDLATKLGLTFQQVQKYEKGTNRISVSRLYEIAAAMHCSYTMLLPGESKKGADQSELISGIGIDKDSYRLVEAFAAIDDPTTRRRLLRLTQSMGERSALNGKRK